MVDVCLVTDGAWPHGVGGVSVWADRLMRSLPDVSFAVAHLHEGPAPSGPAAYEAPPNVREVVHVERDAHALVCERSANESLPEARVYHAAITGAASELAADAADSTGGRLLVTEHGLAWRDARVWGWHVCPGKGGGGTKPPKTDDAARLLSRPRAELSPRERSERAALVARRADAVEALARRAYARADAITSVCAANSAWQRRLGAAPDRLAVIPNAAPAADARPLVCVPGRFRVGLVGRVVPVKDVVGFLRAGALLADALPSLELVVVGPQDETPGYARHCRETARRLGIAERVTFTGSANAAAWYPRLDALALTSVSEAQPLVVLEAMAAGVPVVATDVGGVGELVRGAGLLVAPRDPLAVAGSLLSLQRDPQLAAALAAAGRRRVAARHDGARVHRAYGELYERLAMAT